jgi:hypothetical protein
MYADDLILFGQASNSEVGNLSGVVDTFGIMSGLKINNEKTVI